MTKHNGTAAITNIQTEEMRYRRNGLAHCGIIEDGVYSYMLQGVSSVQWAHVVSLKWSSARIRYKA